jgi:hypothetical protein
MKNSMFEPIIERLSSYHKLISHNMKDFVDLGLNFMTNINQYVLLNIKKIKYDFELRIECYYLGKYLADLKNNRYDLSHDKVFIDHIEKIKFKNTLIQKNNDELSSISKNRDRDI